jgi:hypothetical protein
VVPTKGSKILARSRSGIGVPSLCCMVCGVHAQRTVGATVTLLPCHRPNAQQLGWATITEIDHGDLARRVSRRIRKCHLLEACH